MHAQGLSAFEAGGEFEVQKLNKKYVDDAASAIATIAAEALDANEAVLNDFVATVAQEAKAMVRVNVHTFCVCVQLSEGGGVAVFRTSNNDRAGMMLFR